jgi:hypothetical protein
MVSVFQGKLNVILEYGRHKLGLHIKRCLIKRLRSRYGLERGSRDTGSI